MFIGCFCLFCQCGVFLKCWTNDLKTGCLPPTCQIMLNPTLCQQLSERHFVTSVTLFQVLGPATETLTVDTVEKLTEKLQTPVKFNVQNTSCGLFSPYSLPAYLKNFCTLFYILLPSGERNVVSAAIHFILEFIQLFYISHWHQSDTLAEVRRY